MPDAAHPPHQVSVRDTHPTSKTGPARSVLRLSHAGLGLWCWLWVKCGCGFRYGTGDMGQGVIATRGVPEILRISTGDTTHLRYDRGFVFRLLWMPSLVDVGRHKPKRATLVRARALHVPVEIMVHPVGTDCGPRSACMTPLSLFPTPSPTALPGPVHSLAWHYPQTYPSVNAHHQRVGDEARSRCKVRVPIRAGVRVQVRLRVKVAFGRCEDVRLGFFLCFGGAAGLRLGYVWCFGAQEGKFWP